MPDGTHVLVIPVSVAAFGLSQEVVPESELLDVIGDTEVVIRMLQDLVGMLKSELPAKTTTARYKESGGRSAKRSYNTDRILGRLASGLDGGLFGALRHAVEQDALRLTWRWTELKRLYETLDLPMTVVRHEIADGDPDADVGEVWTDHTKVEAVPDAG